MTLGEKGTISTIPMTAMMPEKRQFVIRIPKSATSNPLALSEAAVGTGSKGDPTEDDRCGIPCVPDMDPTLPESTIQLSTLSTTTTPIIATSTTDIKDQPEHRQCPDQNGHVGNIADSEKGRFRNRPLPDRECVPDEGPDKRTERLLAVEFVPKSANTDEDIQPTWLGCRQYEPFQELFDLETVHCPAFIQVLVGRKWLDARQNWALQRFSFWGGEEGIYTDDSDAVCILKHQGQVPPILSGQASLKVTFQILPRLPSYRSIERNGLISKGWERHSGMSIKLVNVEVCMGEGEARCKVKRPRLKSPDTFACSIRFSSLACDPLLDYVEWPFLDPAAIQRLSAGERLLLEGERHRYRLSLNTDTGKYRVARIEGRGEVPSISELFGDLDWSEISWAAGGLCIRRTFLNVALYRWETAKKESVI